VATNRTVVSLPPGIYTVYSTFKYRQASRVWVPPQYRTVPGFTETTSFPMSSVGTGCTLTNPSQPEFAQSEWWMYTNGPLATLDWSRWSGVEWRVRMTADLTCPALNGDAGTWTARVTSNGTAYVEATTGRSGGYGHVLPNITQAQLEAFRPTNATSQRTTATSAFSLEDLYVEGDALQWTTQAPPGVETISAFFDPANVSLGPWTGTYEFEVYHPGVPELVTEGYYKTVYGPTKVALRYRTVTVVKSSARFVAPKIVGYWQLGCQPIAGTSSYRHTVRFQLRGGSYWYYFGQRAPTALIDQQWVTGASSIRISGVEVNIGPSQSNPTTTRTAWVSLGVTHTSSC
jgi:hypothetical protein